MLNTAHSSLILITLLTYRQCVIVDSTTSAYKLGVVQDISDTWVSSKPSEVVKTLCRNRKAVQKKSHFFPTPEAFLQQSVETWCARFPPLPTNNSLISPATSRSFGPTVTSGALVYLIKWNARHAWFRAWYSHKELWCVPSIVRER